MISILASIAINAFQGENMQPHNTNKILNAVVLHILSFAQYIQMQFKGDSQPSGSVQQTTDRKYLPIPENSP